MCHVEACEPRSVRRRPRKMLVEIGRTIIPPDRPSLTQGDLCRIYLGTRGRPGGVVASAHGLLLRTPCGHEFGNQCGASLVAQAWV